MGYRIATSPNDLVSPGNASRDGARGWLREFAAPCSGLGHEQALEIKWGQHPKRWVTRGFAQPLKGTPIAILVNGSLVTRHKWPDGIREVLVGCSG